MAFGRRRAHEHDVGKGITPGHFAWPVGVRGGGAMTPTSGKKVVAMGVLHSGASDKFAPKGGREDGGGAMGEGGHDSRL